ncbi:MAG: hypothetical protein AAGH57_04500 [Pseudomonadota bacterium]
MAKRKKTSKERYEELMRHAGERKRILAQRALERERLFRELHKAKRLRAQRAKPDTAQRMIERIEKELSKLIGRFESVRGKKERILLKAEIVHLREIMRRLRGGPPRKPPEAGIPVPAVPPRGPLPKQGGAAVFLDFETD